MRFHKKLYISDSINNIDKIKLALKMHKGLIGIYIISLNKGSEQLDIMNAAFLKLPYYRKHPPSIVGIAKGYDEAVDLVMRMLKDSLEYTKSADIKAFLLDKKYQS